MAELDSTQECVDMSVQPEGEDHGSSSSTTEVSSVSGSEVATDQLESSSHSSEEEGAEEEDEASAGWTSKNGKIVWSPTNTETYRYVPAARGLIPGPTRYATARITDPMSSFALLLTEDILQHIVDRTNLQGRRSTANWRDADKDELQAYVGLLILAGVYRSRNEPTGSLWVEKSGRGIFRATMSHNRFEDLSRTLVFDDKQSRARRRDDRMAPFRKVWDMWTQRLPMMFNPDTDICVDEQLVPFRGKCSFRQFVSKKQAKYGIKIWANCDVKTSYVWRLQVCTGKAAGTPSEVNQGMMRVVLDMTKGLKGHTVTCDKFFTSCALADELLKRKLALVGTIRLNKPELPPRLLQVKARAVFSSTFAFTHTHTLVSYIPRRGKNVLLLSTKHRKADVSKESKRKPVIIKDYNGCKGGVDNLDKIVGTYSCRRKTNRWPLALFHNMIDISLYNAFVLWTSIDASWQRNKPHRRRLYNEEVGHMLVTPHIKKRGHPPRSSSAAGIVANLQGTAAGPSAITEFKGRRQCDFCTNRTRKVGNKCCQCGKFTCKGHSRPICGPCST